MRFAEIRDQIVNNPGFNSLEEVKKAGYCIVKERDGERYFLVKQDELKPLLVRLGDIAEVRRGFTTGANEFFYLQPLEMSVAEVAKLSKEDPLAPVLVRNGAGWRGEIEAEFLKPVIKSPREIKTIRVHLEDLRYLVFMCHLSKEELRKQGKIHALEYICWGEFKEYQRRSTCRSRPKWWDLGGSHSELTAWAMIQSERHNVHYNPVKVELDHNFFEIFTKNLNISISLSAICVSTLAILIKELFGRQYGGGSGPIKNEGVDLVKYTILNPFDFSASQRERALKVFEQMANREIKSIFEELGLSELNTDYSNIEPANVSLDKVLPDRRELDAVIFEVLGLTEEEQLAVYRAVVELVKNRLVKARSM